MNYLIGFLIWWALVGLVLCLFLPQPETRKQAFKQWFFLGPFVWVGVLVFGFIWWVKK
ncbi:hypothetical protein OAV22_02090 [Flavobacteriaceae bacterium]|nr:hypothetical protein [Flavobacteriaceae bacterium]